MLARFARRRPDRDHRAGVVPDRRPRAVGHGSGIQVALTRRLERCWSRHSPTRCGRGGGPSLTWPQPLLLLDDDELVRAGTAEMPRGAGYRLTVAGSGYQALALPRDGPGVYALVTDYAMPGMTGAELAREAREPRPVLPVLLVTGYANVTDVEFGGQRRLAKSFRQARLVAAVEELPREVQSAQ